MSEIAEPFNDIQHNFHSSQDSVYGISDADATNRETLESEIARPINNFQDDVQGSKKDVPEKPDGNISISSWKLGWKTPAALFGFFVLACLLAAIHLVLFRYVDGKSAEGPFSISQTYVSVASYLITNSFSASLRASLLVAFSQHMWRIFRKQSTKVSSIENLYGLPHNFFLLFSTSIPRTSPLLFILALGTWLVSIATIYPPSALTAASTPLLSNELILVPTFNPNYSTPDLHITDPEGDDGLGYRFSPIAYIYYDNHGLTYDHPTPYLALESKFTLQSGRIPETRSPCGNNCTFTTSFVGPYLHCNQSTFNTLVPVVQLGEDMGNFYVDYYSGVWNLEAPAYNTFKMANTEDFEVWMSNMTSNVSFNINRPLGVLVQPNMDSAHSLENHDFNLLVETQQLFCIPSRAMYRLNTTYTDGVYNMSLSTEYLGSLAEVCQKGNCAEDQNGLDVIFEAMSVFAII
ncbi:hypothetical protein G7Y89_g2415 [Cudoniella acicularis]|uniref:Uncharacterized protein n=1 Tax=Cudoniella acicularis TaxID=354080 RepID=A0A8H4RUK7_9HELO|nr:hypothetical protein G7Y89_g2415 [Cudoniella acicularis]